MTKFECIVRISKGWSNGKWENTAKKGRDARVERSDQSGKIEVS